MGVSKSKLIDYITSNNNHKLKDLSLSDLIDDICLNKEFVNCEKNFKEFLKDDLLNEEDEDEVKYLRIHELFKRDILINFTDSNQFKDIPNLANNYVFDKFPHDYNNIYYNEFNTKVAKTSNFLLSVFLNLADKSKNKEEIIILMETFQENLTKCEKSQQKFFTIFSIINFLNKLLVIDKQLEEFLKMTDTYTQFLKSYLKDSNLVIYLIREQIYELVHNIKINIIENVNSSLELKKKALVSILKFATSFKIVDLYLEFICILCSKEFEDLNVKQELQSFLRDVSDFKVNFFPTGVIEDKDFKFQFDISYSHYLEHNSNNSICTDGKFLYICVFKKGLFKVGSGKNNTIMGKIYNENLQFNKDSCGSLTFCCGNLYYRIENIEKPFIKININTLNELEVQLSDDESSKKMYFSDREKKKFFLTYELKNHLLCDENRSTEKSNLFSDGQYLYIFSKIGELRLIDGKTEDNLYCGKNLYNVDVFDPINYYCHVTSFPITDPKSLLSQNLNVLDDCLVGDIISDGNLIQFYTANFIITYNMILREISEIKPINGISEFKICYDTFNHSLWFLGSFSKDNNATTLVKNSAIVSSNQFPSKITDGYKNLLKMENFNLIENFNKTFSKGTNEVNIHKENRLFTLFMKPNKITTAAEEPLIDKFSIISYLLMGLSSIANRNLNYPEIQSNIISHLFEENSLNLNDRSIKQIIFLLNYFTKDIENSNFETKNFIISSLLKLIKSNAHQIKLLNFHKFDNFANEFGDLRNVVNNQLIPMISDLFHEDIFRKRFTTNLISELFDTYMRIVQIFNEKQCFDINFYIENLLSNNKAHLVDLKNFVLENIKSQIEISIPKDYCIQINSLMNSVFEKNYNQVKAAIELWSSSENFDSIPFISEFSINIEQLYTPILKDIFLSYKILINSKDDLEKESNRTLFQTKFTSYEILLKSTNSLMIDLFTYTFDIICNLKIESIEKFDNAVDNIHIFLKNNSYCFRFFFASTNLINILTLDKWIVFKKWHTYFDWLMFFDKGVDKINILRSKLTKINSNDENVNLNQESEKFLFETPHPVEKNIRKTKKINFIEQQNIFIEFDKFSSLNQSSSIIITLSTASETKEIKYPNNQYIDSYHENIKEIVLDLQTSAEAVEYGIKLRIITNKKEKVLFNDFHNLNLSIILNCLKSFFFFNFKSQNSLNKETEDLLQSKLFSGGIKELLDFETNSVEYKEFTNSLKSNDNFPLFEKRISSQNGDEEEKENDPFEFEEIVNEEHQSINKAILYFQKSLRTRFPWINLGGINADKIVRSAFAIVIKHERLWLILMEFCNKISEKEEEVGNNITVQDLSKIENFDFFLMIWSEVSRLRQWYNEQIKDLAESNNADFDKQNEAFVNGVIEKCKFLFRINPPFKKHNKNISKLKFSEFFQKASEISKSSKIENELLKVNIINWKKNLMHSKIEETKGDFGNIKNVISNITNCLKLTKISIDVLDNALREINTKARFREIALSLLNSLISELINDDIKHYLIKQIIVLMRKIFNKKIISIEENIKCASPSILNNINKSFQIFLSHIYANMLKSNSAFHIADYLDCLIWNLRARNHKFLHEIQIFKGIFKNSKNQLINSAWKNLIKNKLNYFRTITYLYKFDEKHLSLSLLEFFNIYSSMIVGRIVEENEQVSQEEVSGFFKKKSSILDSGLSVEDLIYDIIDIVVEKISEFINSYSKLSNECDKYLVDIPNIEKIDEDFVNKYCDEYYLNSFLLVLYKYTVNQSTLMLKHLKNPLLISNLFILLQYASPKNRYTLSNFFKIIFKNIDNDDLENAIIFLRKKELFKNKKYINISDDENNFKKFTVYYLLNIIFELRRGVYEKYFNSTLEFEESFYIVDLIRNMYKFEKWTSIIDEIIVEALENLEESKKNLLMPILAVLNGDFEDLHYGSFVSINFEKENPKTFSQRYKDKDDGSLSSMFGYVLGFCKNNITLSEIKEIKDYKLNKETEIRFNRDESSNYVVLAIIDKELYSKNKLRNNEIDIISRPIMNLNIQNLEKITLVNERIINLLIDITSGILKSESENLNVNFKNLFDYYIFAFFVKILGTIAKDCNSSLVMKGMIEKIGLSQMINLISSFDDITYKCSKANQHIFNYLLKKYFDSKSLAEFNFETPIKDKKRLIYIDATNTDKFVKFYSNQENSGSMNIKINFSNLTMTSDSINKIKKFPIVRFKDPQIKSYMNTAIYVDYNIFTNEEVNKIDDINILFIVPKDFTPFVKEVFIHPYIILDCDSQYLDNLLSKLEITRSNTLAKLDIEVKSNLRDENYIISDPYVYNSRSENSINEMINISREMVHKFPTSVKQGDLLILLKKIIMTYLRYSLIRYLHEDESVLNEHNCSNLFKIFKIVFFDCSQEVNTFSFDTKNIEFLNNVFNIFFNFTKNKENLIKINKNTKIFNSYTLTLCEKQIGNQIQSEILEFYFNQRIANLNENLNEVNLLPILKDFLEVTILTFLYDTMTFKEYANLFLEYFSKYCDILVGIKFNEVQFISFIDELLKSGLKELFIYTSLYIKSEIEYSSTTRILTDLSFSVLIKIEEISRKLELNYTFDKLFEITNNHILDDIINNFKLISYKTKDRKLRLQEFFDDSIIKKTLENTIEIPVCNYTFEKRFDFTNSDLYAIRSDLKETKKKMILLTTIDSSRKHKISDFMNDDDKGLVLNFNKYQHLTIINEELSTNSLKVCGYNEKWRLGNETLSDYQYTFIPIEANLDKKVKIKKVVSAYTTTLVLTTNNKIYACGENYCSGLDTLSKVFTLENKWNKIALKEKVVDIISGENTGMMMITNKGIYCSGYNSNGLFSDCCPLNCYTDGILKISSIPFKMSKVSQVSFGNGHTLYRLDDGTVWGSGCNNCFELNFDTQTNYSTITRLNIPSDLFCERVSCGYHVSLFIMREKNGNRRLYSCGDYSYGHSGQTSVSDKRFKKCAGVEDIDFRWCKCRYLTSFAITTDNQIYTFGYNSYGGLGLGDSNTRYVPTKVDFFNGKTVLEADINEKNLLVRCLENDQIKVYGCGYNSYGCIGMGESLGSYIYSPVEITTLSGEYISKISMGATGYSTYFVKSEITGVQNPYVFKCDICAQQSNDICYISRINNVNTIMCDTCSNSSENTILMCSEKINMFHNIKIFSLPDLDSLNKGITSDELNSFTCKECNKNIDKAYILAEEPNHLVLCLDCYRVSISIDIPKLMFYAKKPIDYLKLPFVNSKAIFEFDKSIKINTISSLNTKGINKALEENKEIFININKLFDEIKLENFSEFLKIIDSETVQKNPKLAFSEFTKVNSLAHLSRTHFNIMETICMRIDQSMKKLRSFMDMNNNNRLKELYLTSLPFLSKKSRMEMFEKMLYEGCSDISYDTYSLRLSRGKASKFKQKSSNIDSSFTFTIFSQIMNELKRNNVAISQYKCKKNQRLFRTELIGEGATDAGGPFREVMNIACDDLQSSFVDLFIPTPNNRTSSGLDREKWTINPNSKTNLHLHMFKEIGKLFGWAMRSMNFLNLDLPSFIWKQILNQELDISDLERIDIHTANFLDDLLNLKSKGIEDAETFDSIYDQTFSTILSNGKEVVLIPNKNLTYENRKEYRDLALKCRFDECAPQIQAIREGLLESLDKDIFTLITWRDLEERICGSHIVDIDFLEANTAYEGVSKDEEIVKWFWKALRKFTNDERILYLKFVWGRSRLPLTKEGFDRQHKLTHMYSAHPDISLPLSHTCFFTLDIPSYSSYDILFNKLLYAIKFCGEIDNDFNADQALEEI